jgi:DNA-binding MarR family transcriptional regulator
MRFRDTLGISFYLKILQNEFRQQLDLALKRYKITSAQYAVLSVIEEGDPLTSAELARRCFVSPQTMNRIMKSLVRENFVVRSSNPNHELKLDYNFTKKADKVLCDAHAIVNALELKMVKDLAKNDVQQFLDFMQRSFKNLSE